MTEAARPPWRSAIRRTGMEPDPARFIDPWNDVGLLSYFEEVAKWHGYVRFLGLPHLREDPDQPLAEVFVEPFLSRQPVPGDLTPSRWRRSVQPALAAIAAMPRLVVLGDPGAGKSTLVSWIAWSLSQPRPNQWRDRLGPLIPLPFVLRELAPRPGLTWEGLLGAFLAHPVAAHLGGAERLYDLLERGQGFLLLDGIDEIGSLETRMELRRVVVELSLIFRHCRFLVTSRIVGYEQVSFDQVADDGKAAVPGEVRENGSLHASPWGELRYVAPLDDNQIEQFARRWYERREAAEGLREKGATDLLAAIHGSEATLRLARNPNLLTLMALIHRVQRRLPHGRALLFEKITEAYLDSIDSFRGIQEVNYSFAEKKRWLARVAFEMQRRGHEELKKKAKRADRQGREILASREEVRGWILAAMEGTSHGRDPAAAERYLDYIGRRSGLLLPRSEGLFGFTHLSFQEYFAAAYLAEQITSPRWMRGHAAPGTHREDLRKYAGEEAWREALVLLCELLAERPEWLGEVVDSMFGEGFAALCQSWTKAQTRSAELLAEIAGDPYGGLSKERRRLAWKTCWRWVWEVSQKQALIGEVNRRLTGVDADEAAEMWSIFAEVAAEKPERTTLNLAGASITKNTPWPALHRLHTLSLKGAGIEDLSMLSELSNLRDLDLSRTPVSDLAPLRRLRNLESLSLSYTAVIEASPLRQLHLLRDLDLSGGLMFDFAWLRGLRTLKLLNLRACELDDLRPLEGLVMLQMLNIAATTVKDLSPLRGLRKLQDLRLGQTGVSDLGPLALLHALSSLDLSETTVSDLSPLRGLHALVELDLHASHVFDLAPLASLDRLLSLNLDETHVADLTPLQNLSNLGALLLQRTDVSDLAPLRALRSLMALDLSHTKIRDLSPLRDLKNLIELDLSGTCITDIKPLYLLPNLISVDLSDTQVSTAQLRDLPGYVQVTR